jgi:hypothetical protein
MALYRSNKSSKRTNDSGIERSTKSHWSKLLIVARPDHKIPGGRLYKCPTCGLVWANLNAALFKDRKTALATCINCRVP